MKADKKFKTIKVIVAVMLMLSLAVSASTTSSAYSVGQVKNLTNFKEVKMSNQGWDGVRYRITWKKVSGASGYQVKFYQKDSSYDESWGKWTENTKKTKADVGFSSCYAMKAKVRAYKVVNGKKVYGNWSKTVKKVFNY